MKYYYHWIRVSLIALILFATGGINSYAQKVFQEGVLKYKVTIDGAADQEGIKEYKGTYTITVKGKLIRKELSLDNGFNDITIIDGNTNVVYSLRDLGRKSYAIQLDNKALEKKKEKWLNYTMVNEQDVRKIGDIDASKAKVTYTDGSKCDLYYTTDWQPGIDMFEHFPNIKVLPLSFVIGNSSGMKMHFHLETIEAIPVENALFRVPKGYKIVSYDEYQQINR